MWEKNPFRLDSGRLWALRLLTAMLVAAGPVLGAVSEPGVVVLVHPSNPIETLSRQDVAGLFLKKTTSWSDGSRVLPVDQVDSSPTRVEFSRSVLDRGVDAVEAYWRTQVFSGRTTPPPKMASDAETVRFVASNVGAIGYVSSTTQPRGVKLLRVAGLGAAAAAPAVDGDRGEIQTLLARYEAAYEKRDIVELRSVWPSLTDELASKIDQGFALVRSWELDLEMLNLELGSASGSARCRRSVSMVSVDGQRLPHVTESTFRFEKSARGWVIASVE